MRFSLLGTVSSDVPTTPTRCLSLVRSGFVGVGLLLSSSGSLSSAELVIRDVAVRFQSQPTEFTYTAENDVFSRTGTDYFSSAFALAVGARYSVVGPGRSWGPILGFDVELADARNATSHLQTGELCGVAGLGWQSDPSFTWLAQLAVGAGYGRMTIDPLGGDSSGQVGSVTPAVGVWWRATERVRLTFDVGWRVQSAVMHHGNTALDLRQKGSYFAVGVSWGLSRAPWSLE